MVLGSGGGWFGRSGMACDTPCIPFCVVSSPLIVVEEFFKTLLSPSHLPFGIKDEKGVLIGFFSAVSIGGGRAGVWESAGGGHPPFPTWLCGSEDPFGI